MATKSKSRVEPYPTPKTDKEIEKALEKSEKNKRIKWAEAKKKIAVWE